MNANVAYYSGLAAGGAFDGDLTQTEILTEVANQKPDIRSYTTDWLYEYLLLALGPLEQSEFDAYLAFSQSDAGDALNAVLLTAFDRVFEDISYGLGYEAARVLAAPDL